MANEFIIRKGFKSQEDSQITGSISLSGSFKDQESSSGTAGQVLSSTVSGSQWVDIEDPDAVTGAGTTGKITKWTTGGSVIGDSIITESTLAEIFSTFTMGIDSFNSVALGGQIDISFNSNPSITSNQLAGNTFTFTGANIGTIPAGSYTIGSNDASTSGLGGDKVRITLNPVTQTDTNSGGGNSQVVTLFTTGDPTLEVDGATTFTGNVNVGGTVSSPTSVGTIMGVIGRNGVGGGTAGIVLKDFDNDAWDIWNSGGGLNFRYNNGTSALTISSGGDVTLNGNGTTSALLFGQSSYARIINTSGQTLYVDSDVHEFRTNGGVGKLTISSGGDTTITTTTNQGGLAVTSATDNTTLRLINTATSGQDWRLYSTGGSSGLGAGKLFIKVGTTETAARLVSFVDGGSDIKVGIGTNSPDRNLSVVSTTDTTVEIKSGNANQSSLFFSDVDDGNIGGVLYTHNDNSMAFRVNDSTRLTISSGGDVILGPYKATPASTYNKFYYMKSAPYFWDCGNTYNPNYEIAAIAMGAPGPGQDDGEILFQTATNVCSNNASSVLTTRARIIETGEFEMYNGIKFPNGGNTTLDAYEEATWTPNVQSTAGGAYTISNARGKYIKVGKHVTVQFYFVVSAVNGGTGARITNLPFATKSGAAGDNYIGNSWNTSNGQLSSAVAAQNGTIAIIYVYSGGNPIGQGQGNTGTITYISQS